MSDLADRAIEREEELRADQLRAQQRAAALDAPGNDICADCGEPIPESRRRAMPSAIRCIDCQAWAERLGKMQSPGVGGKGHEDRRMTLELFLSIGTGAAIVVSGYWALARLVVAQFWKRLDERLAAQELARQENRRIWDERFMRIEERLESNERDITQLMRELPTSYLRREDAIRENTTINAKLDALNARLEHFITMRSHT